MSESDISDDVVSCLLQLADTPPTTPPSFTRKMKLDDLKRQVLSGATKSMMSSVHYQNFEKNCDFACKQFCSEVLAHTHSHILSTYTHTHTHDTLSTHTQ